MATLTTLVDGTVPAAADFNGNFSALNTETRAVSVGGTGLTTITANRLVYGNGTSALGILGAMTDGQLVIGSTGTTPAIASLTAGSGITVTPGAGTITLAATVTGNDNENAVLHMSELG